MSTQASMPAPDSAKRQAWWKEPTMWLVVGGPTIVVVASFLTLSLALRFPDPVIEDRGQAAESDSAPGSQAKAAALTPAMKARNHAATGGQ